MVISIFCILHVCYICVHVYVYTMWVQCLWNPKEGNGSPGTGVTASYETPCGYWEVNPGPPQKQQVLLTSEQPLQPLCFLTEITSVS